MKKGVITINGNALCQVGSDMTGGEIHVNGEIERMTIGAVKHGKVYNKGRLWVDK